MHIIIVTHDNSLPVLGATSDIPAERYSSPYLFLSDLAVKPPTSGGGYKAIINYCNLTFLMIKCKV